jgi:Uri superfamily endonuclease
MTYPSKHYSLAALMLACAMLTACGGGTAEAPPSAAVNAGGTTAATLPDATPPTVTIANNVSAPVSNGPVTFTFVFSKDVGISFDTTDVVITGGTASAFNRISGSQATVVVTPTPSTTGTINVSVAAGSFTDVAAGKSNTVGATASKDYSTIGGGTGGAGGGGTGTAPANAPSTAIPAGSTVIYSDAAAVTGFDSCPSWGQATVCAGEQTIAGNKVLKYSNLNYEGLDWSATPQNVSTKSKLHIDFWSPDVTSVKVSIISANKENAVTQALTTGVWNGVDIDLAQYTVPDKTAIIQIKIESTTPGTLYIDNIYFAPTAIATCGTTDPTCAPTTAVPAGAIVIYSDAAAVTGFDSCPSWGQATVCNGEQTIAGNKVLKYSNLNYEGMDWAASAQNVSTKGKLHVDFWTPDLTSVKVSIISANRENAVTQALTTKGWNTVDIPLSSYTVPDQTAIIQIKLESTTPGTLFVDNIYFWDAPASGGGAFTPADMGSRGPQTLVLSTGDSKGIFTAGEAIFAFDYKGGLDASNNFASYTGGHTDGTPGGGTIGYFNDTAMSVSSQKLEEGGWIVGTSLDPGGIPNFFRYFLLLKPETAFTSSFMGLFANAPNDGTLNVSSFGSIKFRLWGPAEMYQLPNLNPVLELVLSGPKVAGCTATGSGGTEISKNVTANQKIGAASAYKVGLAGFTVKGVCGSDTNATAVASVLANLARVAFTVPAGSFNWLNLSTGATPAYPTGVNLGPIGFTNQ